MKNTKIPNLISVLILTLLTSILWVSFSVYRAFAVKPAESVPEPISNPLSPTLEVGVIKQIEERIFIGDSGLPDLQLTLTATASPIPTSELIPTPTETPVATGSATPTATPIATP